MRFDTVITPKFILIKKEKNEGKKKKEQCKRQKSLAVCCVRWDVRWGGGERKGERGSKRAREREM